MIFVKKVTVKLIKFHNEIVHIFVEIAQIFCQITINCYTTI